MASPSVGLTSGRVGVLRSLTAGTAFFGAAGVWTLVAAAASGSRPWPILAVLVAAAATLVVTSLMTSLHRSAVPVALLIVAGALAIRPDIVERKPTSGPFGYVNATGAFYMLAAIAALMLAATSSRQRLRLAARVIAVACAVVPFAVGSMASAWLVIAMPLIAVMLSKALPQRAVVAILAGIAACGLAATMILGGAVGHSPSSGTLGKLADTELSARRLALWHDALTLIATHPVTGVGPGRFAVESPTARSDSDTRWAHNGFLQFGAETGIPGLVLLLSIFAWGFATLARSAPGTVSTLAAAGVAALAIVASVDYVMSFPAIPLAASALVGTAIGGTAARQRLKDEIQ